jgi:hypothetical protein
MSNANKKLSLFASSSFAALLIGAGMPSAWAAPVCQVTPANTGIIICIDIQNMSVGRVTHSDSMPPA